MSGENEMPLMLQYMFGEAAGMAAGLAWRTASPRLLRWAQAFEDWLDEGERSLSKDYCRHRKRTWRRLLTRGAKSPWDLRRADIMAHKAWMEAQGYADSTVNIEMTHISRFYEWCSQKGIDPQCDPGFNPAAQVERLPKVNYKNIKVLSRQEAQDLLGLLAQDEALLSKRDYALFLARLNLGVLFKPLRDLKWGQIETDEQGAWVRWRQDEERERLPAAVWQAMVDYLKAAGRLERMAPETYIFTTLQAPLIAEPSGKAQEWHDNRPVSNDHILNILQKYGKLAGIPTEKLTLRTLRYTAIALRVAAGDSPEEIRSFMHNSRKPGELKAFLQALPPLPREAGQGEKAGEGREETLLPERKPNRYQPGDNMTHGFRAKNQPPEDLAKLREENPTGLDQEIRGLREMERRLMGLYDRAQSQRDQQKLRKAYTMAASRMKNLRQIQERQAKRSSKTSWAEEYLKVFDNAAIAEGKEPPSIAFRQEVLGGEHVQALDSPSMVEEIENVRTCIRRCRKHALETEDIDELVNLVEEYGLGCLRLARLLEGQANDDEILAEALGDMIDRALAEVLEELGLE